MDWQRTAYPIISAAGKIISRAMLMKAEKNTKKLRAFTLVELIVVMVILAILVALMVPTLTKYIDKANDQGILVEARYCLTALQTYASGEYGSSRSSGTALKNKINTDIGSSNRADSEIYQLAEAPGKISAVDVEGSRVVAFTYTDQGNTRKVSWTKDNGFGKVEEIAA